MAGDLNRPIEADLRNAHEALDILGNPFGSGQWRSLVGFAETVAAVAGAADGFINRLTVGNHRRFAGLGLIRGQFVGGRVRRVNLLVDSAAVTIEYTTPRNNSRRVSTMIQIGAAECAAIGSASGV